MDDPLVPYGLSWTIWKAPSILGSHSLWMTIKMIIFSQSTPKVLHVLVLHPYSRAGKSKVAGCSATATTTFQKNVARYRYYYFLKKSSVLLYFTLEKVVVLLFRYFFHYFSHNLSILFDIF